MVDDLRPDDGARERDQSRHGQPKRPAAQPEHPLADREVSITGHEAEARVLTPAVHGWLDGELPEASLRKNEGTQDIEFWKRISAETDTRRRMRTPVHLEARIMEALPQTAPQIITPWWHREFVVTPTTAVTTAGALVAITAALTALIMAMAR